MERDRDSWGWWQVGQTVVAIAMLVAMVILSACSWGFGSDAPREAAHAAGGIVTAVKAGPAHASGSATASLFYAGWFLCAVAAVSFVVSFVPVVSELIKRSMSIWCAIVGVGCLVVYDWMVEWRWIIKIAFPIGCILLVWGHRKAIRAAWIKVHELFTHKDEDGDGQIGPKYG